MDKQNSTNPSKIIIFPGFHLKTFLNEVSWSGNCRSPAPCDTICMILYVTGRFLENRGVWYNMYDTIYTTTLLKSCLHRLMFQISFIFRIHIDLWIFYCCHNYANYVVTRGHGKLRLSRWNKDKIDENV